MGPRAADHADAYRGTEPSKQWNSRTCCSIPEGKGTLNVAGVGVVTKALGNGYDHGGPQPKGGTTTTGKLQAGVSLWFPRGDQEEALGRLHDGPCRFAL